MLSDAWLQLGIAYWEQRHPGEAIESWKKSLAFNPAQWKAREYLEEFTSDYSRPRVFGKPEFFHEFQNIQIEKFLSARNENAFASFDEAERILRQITEAWNGIPDKWKIEELADIERFRYFRSVDPF
jgi:tetratricopeptide (TPR) repeat protein